MKKWILFLLIFLSAYSTGLVYGDETKILNGYTWNEFPEFAKDTYIIGYMDGYMGGMLYGGTQGVIGTINIMTQYNDNILSSSQITRHCVIMPSWKILMVEN